MHALVLQTDFGLGDGAVSAMYGVAKQVHPKLEIFDLTHNIPPYDIWSAAYRLVQTINYWPEGTVFVSVVDPGVGSHRRSVAAKTKNGQIVITPDNGSLSQLIYFDEVLEVRAIDEVKSRLPHSQESHTFHGRDIYAYNGARIACGEISYEEVGELIDKSTLEYLPVETAKIENEEVQGHIDVLDVRFGSLWTNITSRLLKEYGVQIGDFVEVDIFFENRLCYQGKMPFVKSFAGVDLGEALIYVNSLNCIGVALNQKSFAKTHQVSYGKGWTLKLRKVKL